MAERKPLIAADALPSSSISRIIRRDRQESGRDEADLDNAEQAAGRTVDLTSKPVSLQNTNQASELPVVVEELSAADELATRVKEMVDTPMLTVSLRMPSGLNDWVDTYVFTHRKKGVKKQDMIAKAIELLILNTEGSENPPKGK